MPRLRPFLMFQGEAETALDLYLSLFADAETLMSERYGVGEPGPEGSFKRALVRIAGQEVFVFDSPPVHAFGFTPAISLFVDCDEEREMDRLLTGLGEGGSFLMPPGDYGFSRKFAWLNDRFGVSWQINLS